MTVAKVVTEDTKEPAPKTRGPKRLSYLPAQYADIAGADTLTTVRQLTRLADYLSVAPEARAPFVRLGSSVAARRGRRKPATSSTYAVDVDGMVSVVHRKDDPRRAYEWMQNERRPWHLCRNARLVPGRRKPVSVKVVTFGAILGAGAAAPDWSGDVVPTVLVPDAKLIRRVWPCAARRDGSTIFREFVVEGFGHWSDQVDHPDLIATREALHEVIPAEGATLWIGEEGAIEFQHYSWADGELLQMVGGAWPDIMSVLRERLADRLRLCIAARCSQEGVFVDDDRVRSAVTDAVAAADFQLLSLTDVASMETALAVSLCGAKEVVG